MNDPLRYNTAFVISVKFWMMMIRKKEVPQEYEISSDDLFVRGSELESRSREWDC